ncbi:DegT/DnrJ/EryC1/StrS family aminotransferase [bacterium]|nr:DegT/DnrJ/EryC1/StrS family aminotransferase [bacterium]
MRKVEFFRHNLGRREKRDVCRALDGLFLTTGKLVEQFEEQLAAYLGAPYTVGVTSCTGAMHLALLASGVGPGDEVITTPMTFSATALAVIMAGATPVFVDVEPGTGNMDAGRVEAALTGRTKALLPVHLYGQMCDMRALRAIADRHNLALIEDAAHALEASRDGVRVGELGDFACFSFYPTKSITCGEGGAVSVHDAETADLLKSLRHHGMDHTASERYGKDDVAYQITRLGWKYNMDNLQAALLPGQLERAGRFLARRTRLAGLYRKKLSGVPGITFMDWLPGCVHSHHVFTLLAPADKRARLLAGLKERGIGVSINYIPVHLQKFFRDTYGFKPGDFPVAEAIGASTLTLPLYPKLRNDELDYVVRSVKDLALALRFDRLA